MTRKLAIDVLTKVPKFEQWPAVMLVVIAMILCFFGWFALEAINRAVPAAWEVAAALNRFDATVRQFNSDLGGGTDRIVATVEIVGRKLDRLPEMERKIDAMPLEVWRAMGSPVITSTDDRSAFQGGG